MANWDDVRRLALGELVTDAWLVRAPNRLAKAFLDENT